ncbi:MAG: protein kinase domain-containing protein, partial [Stackebrandtia sp.]
VPIVDAYDRLHKRGVAHGDVSRHNILIDPLTQAVGLVDFESSSRQPGDERLRRRFTWAYAAPEFAHDASRPSPPRQLPTPASDQYAVAAVLYRQLTGHYPRPTVDGAKPDSPQALTTPARPLAGEPCRQWPGLDMVFATALSPNPADRFATMADFAEALGTVLNGR